MPEIAVDADDADDPAGDAAVTRVWHVMIGLAVVLVAIVVGRGDGGASGANGARFSVYAASQLRAPFAEYASPRSRAAIKASTPWMGDENDDLGTPAFTIAPSAALAARIRHGDKPDVIVADGPLLDALYTAGYVEEPVTVATNPQYGPLANTPAAPSRSPNTYGAAIVIGTKHAAEAKAFVFSLVDGIGSGVLSDSHFGAAPPISHRPRKPAAVTEDGV